MKLTTDGARPFALQSWVQHPRLGKGVVVSYERNRIVVLFDRGGKKEFQLDAALQQSLLTPSEESAGQ